MEKFGIDISKYQKDMNLTTAKNEGVEFVIMRGMYGNSKDTSFEDNYNKAKSNGLGVGVYWWTRAVNEAQAKEEAEILINNCLKGKQFEYPIYIDVEDSLLANLGKDRVDAIIRSALTTLEKAGYYAGFYLNYDWYINKCHGPELAKRFTLWLARWSSVKQDVPMWQFGGETNYIRNNKIAGMVCDQDYCYVDFPNIIKSKGKNGYGGGEIPTPTPTPSPSPQPSSSTTYIVKKGDTLSAIASKFGTTYQKIAQDNGIADANKIYVGQVLNINGNGSSNQAEYYTVQKGDNLTKIANKYGTTINQIATWNNIADVNKIYVGQKLRVK